MTDIVLDKHLGIVELPEPFNVNTYKRRIKQLSSLLFDEMPKKISHSCDLGHASTVHMYKATFQDGSKKDFYVKQSWEGVYKEALGMTLANMLQDAGHNYFLWDDRFGNHNLVMENLPGEDFYVPKGKEKEVAFNLGYSMELVNALSLKDRWVTNVLLTETFNINHIDFGSLFYPGDNGSIEYLIDFHSMDSVQLNKGRVAGKEVVRQNFKDNKNLIEDLIVYARSFEDFTCVQKPVCDDPFVYMCDYLGVAR
jgi:hypothetical protein